VNTLREGQPALAVPSPLPSGRVGVSWVTSLGRGMLCPRVWSGLASAAGTPADLAGSSLIPAVLQRNGLFKAVTSLFFLLYHKTNVVM